MAFSGNISPITSSIITDIEEKAGGELTVKAVWNGVILAESSDTIIIEGNHYFPPDSVNFEYFTPTKTRSWCPWKGEAIYFTITVEGSNNMDAAWTYQEPKPAAREIRGYVAFWKDIEIID